MKNIFFYSLVVVSLPILGRAQEPVSLPAVASNTKGKVLVLENERTLEGDIERIGDQYRIRRAIGETWLPSTQVLCLCANAEEAYLFLRGRSNLTDGDERLKLAEWCHRYGLRPQALAEAQAAATLRPTPASKRLFAYLQQQATQPKPATPKPPTIPEIDSQLTLNLELTGEAMGQFTSRVQPILMNSCASCHAAGRGGPFKLNRVGDLGNRRYTQQNLASVLATLNTQQPEASPFLTKALSMHGEMTQAPFRNRQTPAYRALEEWVHLTVSSNPKAIDSVRDDAPRFGPSGIPPAPPASAAPLRPAGPRVPDPAPAPAASTYRPAIPVEQGTTAASPPPAVPPSKSASPPQDDPWDGEHFNQGAGPPQQPPMPQAPQPVLPRPGPGT
jgi:hypothetical protein